MKGKSGIAPEIMTSIPKSDGAAQKSFSENIKPIPNQGSFNYIVPMAVPLGRVKKEIDLSLIYDLRRAGNSPFGQGWDIPMLNIQRKTIKGFPAYNDEDRFALSNGGELLYIGNNEYKPAKESDFSKIIRNGDSWEITYTNGTKISLGTSESSRLLNPDEPTQIFAWYVAIKEDTNGNVLSYEYERDETVKYPEGYLSAKIYLKKIYYTNSGKRYLNAVQFDYIKNRNDAWTGFKAGFPVRTNYLCYQMVSFSCDVTKKSTTSYDFNPNPIDLLDLKDQEPDNYVPYGFYLKPIDRNKAVIIDFPIPLINPIISLITTRDKKYCIRVNDGADIEFIPGDNLYVLSELTADPIRSIKISSLEDGELKLGNIEYSLENIPVLFSRYKFNYCNEFTREEDIDNESIKAPFKQLKTVQRLGYEFDGNHFIEKDLPPQSFTYKTFSTKEIFPRALGGTPNESLDDENTTLISFAGTGRPDILQTLKDNHRLFYNKGKTDGPGVSVVGNNFVEGNPVKRLDEKDVMLRDIKGLGAVDYTTQENYYQNPSSKENANPHAPSWENIQTYDAGNIHPQLSVGEIVNTRTYDINSDGLPDLLKTEDDFVIWKNLGEGAWKKSDNIQRISSFGESLWPDIFFSNPQIFLEDMNGDGVDEICRVSARKVEYWCQANGEWKYLKSTMKNSPRFKNFEPSRVLLGDITGSGTADLVYVHGNSAELFFNCGGKYYSNGLMLDFRDFNNSRDITTPMHTDSLALVDMDGSGVKGLLWSYTREETETNYYFLPLSQYGKPFLLESIENGIGGKIELSYSTTAILSAFDEESGVRWNHCLPYPLMVITSIKETDLLSGNSYQRDFWYRNGYYDRVKRNFQGFSYMSEQQKGNSHIESLFVEKNYYNGVPVDDTQREIEKARILAGMEIETRNFAITPEGLKLLTISANKVEIQPVYRWTEAAGVRTPEANPLSDRDTDEVIYFPYVNGRLVSIYERTETPKHKLTNTEYTVDIVGNLVLDEFGRKQYEINYGEVRIDDYKDPFANFTVLDYSIISKTTWEYALNIGNYIAGLVARITKWGWDADNFTRLLFEECTYYDWANNRDGSLPFQNVNQGNVQRKEILFAKTAFLSNAGMFEATVLDELGDSETAELGYYKRIQTVDNENGLFAITVRSVYLRDANDKIIYGKPIHIYNAYGSEKDLGYDHNKNFLWHITSITNGLGHEERIDIFNYQVGQPAKVADVNNVITELEYDVFGNPLKKYVYDPADGKNAAIETNEYNFFTYINNDPSTPTYKIQKRLIDSAEDPLRYTENVEYYDGWGRIMQSKIHYDTRQFQVISKCYASSHKEPTWVSLPFFDTVRIYKAPNNDQKGTSSYFDAMKRIRKTVLPDNTRIEYRYEPFKELIYDENDLTEAGEFYNTPVTRTYNANGLLSKIKEIIRYNGVEDIAETIYQYSPLGNLDQITDAEFNNIKYTYSLNGKLLKIEHPDAGITLKLNDAAGNLVYTKNALNEVWWYEYDELGRINKEIFNDRGNTLDRQILYEYDDPRPADKFYRTNRLRSLSYNRENFYTEHKYNKFGNLVDRMIRINPILAEKHIIASFNELGQIKERTIIPNTPTPGKPGRLIKYSYGYNGNPKSVDLSFVVIPGEPEIPDKKLIDDITYHESGRVKKMDYLNGVFPYNADFLPENYRLRELKYGADENILFLQDYTYDAVGNIVSSNQNLPRNNEYQWKYNYDSIYRIRNANFEGMDKPYLYDYDKVGNCVRNDEFLPEVTLHYNHANKPNSITGTDANPGMFDYDDCGRTRQSDEFNTIQWNKRDRIAQVTNSDGDDETYDYYPDGNIMHRSNSKDGVDKSIIYIAEDEDIYITDEEGINVKKIINYIMINGSRVLAVDESDNVNVYAFNHLGSTIRIINDAGVEKDEYDEVHAPFGKIINAHLTLDHLNLHGYAGTTRCLGKSYSMGARNFFSGLGRFISVEPMFREIMKKDFLEKMWNISSYGYGWNNPLIYFDATGFQPRSARGRRGNLVPRDLPPRSRENPFEYPEYHRDMINQSRETVGSSESNHPADAVSDTLEKITKQSQVNPESRISERELEEAKSRALISWIDSPNYSPYKDAWGLFTFRWEQGEWMFKTVKILEDPNSRRLMSNDEYSLVIIAQVSISDPYPGNEEAPICHPDFPEATVSSKEQ